MRTRWEAEKHFALFMICSTLWEPEVYKICGGDLPKSSLSLSYKSFADWECLGPKIEHKVCNKENGKKDGLPR